MWAIDLYDGNDGDDDGDLALHETKKKAAKTPESRLTPVWPTMTDGFVIQSVSQRWDPNKSPHYSPLLTKTPLNETVSLISRRLTLSFNFFEMLPTLSIAFSANFDEETKHFASLRCLPSQRPTLVDWSIKIHLPPYHDHERFPRKCLIRSNQQRAR